MKKSVAYVLSIILLLLCSAVVGCTEEGSPFVFEIVDGEAYLVKYQTGNASDLEDKGLRQETESNPISVSVPKYYRGNPVVGIGLPGGNLVFSQLKLKKIVLPSRIKYIQSRAFEGQEALETIEFSPENPEELEIGYDAFSGTPFLEKEKVKARQAGRNYVLFHEVLICLLDHSDKIGDLTIQSITPASPGDPENIFCKGIAHRALAGSTSHRVEEWWCINKLRIKGIKNIYNGALDFLNVKCTYLENIDNIFGIGACTRFVIYPTVEYIVYHGVLDDPVFLLMDSVPEAWEDSWYGYDDRFVYYKDQWEFDREGFPKIIW